MSGKGHSQDVSLELRLPPLFYHVEAVCTSCCIQILYGEVDRRKFFEKRDIIMIGSQNLELTKYLSQRDCFPNRK
jgi:hypothetical protein